MPKLKRKNKGKYFPWSGGAGGDNNNRKAWKSRKHFEDEIYTK